MSPHDLRHWSHNSYVYLELEAVMAISLKSTEAQGKEWSSMDEWCSRPNLKLADDIDLLRRLQDITTHYTDWWNQ